MSTGATIAIIVAIVIVLAIIVVAAWAMSRQRRSRRLHDQFGPEYDRTVNRVGSRKQAENALEQRRDRVEKLNIRPLRAEDRARFAESWRSAQAQFVDAPAAAVTGADQLVTEVMQARGYPIGDFEQRAADVSVDHPDVVANYRSARTIALSNGRGEASTEDLRQAMVHYRALFRDLLGEEMPARAGARE